MFEMEINGQFALFSIIALVFFVLSIAFNSWIGKLVTFIVSLGAATIATTITSLDLGLVLVINVVLFIATGLSALRIKKSVGNRILGIVLFGLGVLLIIPTVNALGSDATGTIWTGVVDSFRQGLESIGVTFDRVFSQT